jgi:NTP pyrophosphatase (non-canonical NTP hydrolase)
MSNITRPAWFPFADALHRAVVAVRAAIAAKRGRTLEAYDADDGEFLAMGLAGEAGEVANEFKKLMRGDYTSEEFTTKVSAELADVRCMLELVARYVGVDLDEVTPRKLEDFERKLIARGWLAAPVAARPPGPQQPRDGIDRYFRCDNGHETVLKLHTIKAFECQHKHEGAVCGAVATFVREGHVISTRTLVCGNGHETPAGSNVESTTCLHHDAEIGATCGAVALPKPTVR